MKLTSADDSSLELTVVGYQFPEFVPGRSSLDASHWDANWLVVRGCLVSAAGAGSEFEDPCLTTWEARQLADWLDVVSGDAVRLPERVPPLTFTEPALSFRLAATGAVSVEIRMWARRWGRTGRHQSMFTVQTTAQALAVQAQVWRGELAGFPVR